MKGQKRIRRSYPRQLKLKVAEEIIMGLKGKAEASRDYDIPVNTVAKWEKRFESEVIMRQSKEVLPLRSMSKRKNKNVTDLESQMDSLEKENQELRKKLTESNLRADALSTLLDLAEENYGLSLRKNSGAKQSRD